MERKSYRFEGVVTALSSISHIGDNFGANIRLRREKIVQTDGTVEDVPILSGNGVRGLLRDLGMRHMMAQMGNPPLSMPAFYFLFSGGTLTKQAGKGLDVDQGRSLQRLIPLVGVFGGAVGNQIMPGRLQVGKLVPVCLETAHLMPESMTTCRQVSSIYNYLQEEAYTRKDDEKDERLRYLLAEPERKLLDVKAETKKANKEAGNDIDTEAGQHQQMRYYVEVFSAGTTFHWWVELKDVTQIEFESFISCFVEFSKSPVIGGKGNVGHGRVAVKFDNWFEISPLLQSDTNQLSTPLGTLYHAHLATERENIVAALGAL